MKTFRYFATTFVLLCSLSTAAIAGEIQGVGFTPPPPPPPPEDPVTAAYEMPNSDMLILELLGLFTIL